MSFTCSRDNDKAARRPLRCRLSGITPAARFWTLTLYNADGELVANSVNRYGFTSQEIVRRPTALSRSRRAARQPRQLAADRRRRAIRAGAAALRTAVGVSTKAGREVPMPDVNTRSCP